MECDSYRKGASIAAAAAAGTQFQRNYTTLLYIYKCAFKNTFVVKTRRASTTRPVDDEASQK